MFNKIYLEVNGVKYEGFTDISVTRSIENFANQFSFSTTVREGSTQADDLGFTRISSIKRIQNDLMVQDEVRVFIDDNLILTGFIEDLNISYDAGSHSISVSGRDKTGDLIDSSTQKKVYTQLDFIKLVEKILSDNGYSSIKVINNLTAGSLTTLDNSDNTANTNSISPENNDSIAQFIDSIAKKVQVLVYTNKDGNLVVTREGDEEVNGSLINTANGENNNILSGNIKVSSLDRFNRLFVFAQAGNKDFTSQTVSQQGDATDSEVRTSRKKIINYNKPSLNLSLQNYAKWSINIRRAKGARYNCRVQGYYTTRENKEIWQPNTLVQIKDDLCQVNGQFLIQGVTYTKSNQGSFTDLSIVNRGAFSVDGGLIANASDFASNLFRSA